MSGWASSSDPRPVENLTARRIRLVVEYEGTEFAGWQRQPNGPTVQAAIADDTVKDAFGLAYSVVSQLWEALSPDPMLKPHRDDYKWLTDVYESVRPADITGRLVWHALGAKTIELINENVHVEIPQGAETIVLDAQTIEDLMTGKRKDVPIEEIEKQITARIARHLNNPVFIELGQRLNALREKYADIQQSSLDFLRELLELAKDTVAAEKAEELIPREEKGRAALTELFEALKGDETPIIVSNVVDRIDVHYQPGHISADMGETKEAGGQFLAVGCKFSKDRFLPVGPLHPENEQLIDIRGEKMKMLADHPVYPEPHDFIIVKREKIKTRQVFNVDDFPLATKDPKDSGVTRNGNKVTVRLVSQAPAYSLREFKIKKGDEVTIILTNLDKVEDLTHGFAIPKYDINFIVNPQETKSVTFKADKPGVYWCYCTHFCHALHLEMRTRMFVEK